MVTQPIVANVAHVGLTVSDLDDAIVMWCDELGFTLERTFALTEEVTARTTGVRDATIQAATVTLGTHRIELLQYTPPDKASVHPTPSTPGTVHIALTAIDLEHVLSILSRHHWRSIGTPHVMTAGANANARIIYLSGPQGGFIELIFPPKHHGRLTQP